MELAINGIYSLGENKFGPSGAKMSLKHLKRTRLWRSCCKLSTASLDITIAVNGLLSLGYNFIIWTNRCEGCGGCAQNEQILDGPRVSCLPPPDMILVVNVLLVCGRIV